MQKPISHPYALSLASVYELLCVSLHRTQKMKSFSVKLVARVCMLKTCYKLTRCYQSVFCLLFSAFYVIAVHQYKYWLTPYHFIYRYMSVLGGFLLFFFFSFLLSAVMEFTFLTFTISFRSQTNGGLLVVLSDICLSSSAMFIVNKVINSHCLCLLLRSLGSC